MNKKLNKTLRTLCIVSLWIVLIVASYKAYNLYEYNKLYPQKEYTWSSFEGPPKEFTIKNDMMKSIKNTIQLGILIAIIWEVLLYFNNPEGHFITYLNKKLKPIMDKLNKLEDE